MNAQATTAAKAELLAARFSETRRFSEYLCESLEVEDFVVQSMPDVSPTRWHLAHSTWFFETFVLARAIPDYTSVDPTYRFLFNSYYERVGQQFPRPRRGLLTRPTVAEVFDYRHAVDRQLARMLAELGDEDQDLLRLVETGIYHEQQHQELLLTDIKHVFSCNPLFPAYRDAVGTNLESPCVPDGKTAFEGGLIHIGHSGESFAFDNERPRHQVFLKPYHLHNRLVTNAEYQEFIDDGGYERADLWLSLGWATVGEQGWTAPLYWYKDKGEWSEFTLGGLRPLRGDEPVCHVSYFEADAYARWSGYRLPTEGEWEHAASAQAVDGSFVESEHFHPSVAATKRDGLDQLFGELWQWTSSPYAPYPGFRAPPGALGEYNGKFMCNQYVLRGGSCATSSSHIRPTYRNFFPPDARWQFSGIRLAED